VPDLRKIPHTPKKGNRPKNTFCTFPRGSVILLLDLTPNKGTKIIAEFFAHTTNDDVIDYRVVEYITLV